MTKTISYGLLQAVLKTPHALALTAGSPAHENGLKFVNAILPHEQGADFILELARSLLPETYAGNLLEEIPTMVKTGIEKGLDLTKAENKGPERKQSELLLDIIDGSDVRFFQNSLGEPYVKLPGKHGGYTVHRLRSSAAKDYFRRAYFRREGKPPSAHAVNEVLDHLEAVARYDSPIEEVHIRVAQHDGNVFIDLGDETNRAIKVSPDGWELVAEPPVNFIRPNGTFGALPAPERGFDPESLRQALNMSKANFILLVAYCISAFNPDGPYFLLQIHGEQGSGKSNIGKFAKDMIDPNQADKLRLPKGEQDLVLHAQAQWVLNYDNASYVTNDMSDALCTFATGGAFATRKLYTDSEQVTFVFKRPVILNGIGNYATRPDLQERSIPLNLSAIPEGKRRTEREMAATLAPLKPQFLGYLLDCVAHALASLDGIEPPRSVRMADAAHWLVAAEGATGFPEGAILDALELVQNELLTQTTADDGLTSAILALLLQRDGHVFEGRYSQLHELLTPDKHWAAHWLPKSPSALSSKLSRLAPGLRRIGVEIAPGARTSGGKTVVLRLTDEGVELAKNYEEGRENDPDTDTPAF